MPNDEWSYLSPEAVEELRSDNIHMREMEDSFNADLQAAAIKKYAQPHHTCARCPGCNEVENKAILNTNIYGLCFPCNIDRLNHTTTYYLLKEENNV